MLLESRARTFSTTRERVQYLEFSPRGTEVPKYRYYRRVTDVRYVEPRHMDFLDALPQPFRLLHEILQEEVLDRVYIAIDAMELSSTFRKERPVKPLVPSSDLTFESDSPIVTALMLTGEGRSFAVGMADGTVALNSIDGIDTCASAPARVFAAGVPVAAVEAGSWDVCSATKRHKVAVLAVRGAPPLAPETASETVAEGDKETPVDVPAEDEAEADPAVAAADAALARRSVVVLRGSIGASGANVLTALATIETDVPPSVVRMSADSAFVAVYSAESRALRLYSVPRPEDDPAAAEEEGESAAREGPAVGEASEGDAGAAGGDGAGEAATIAAPIAPPLPVLRALLSIAAPSAFPSAAPWPTFTASEAIATKLVVRWRAEDALVSRQVAQYALPPRPAARGARALFNGLLVRSSFLCFYWFFFTNYSCLLILFLFAALRRAHRRGRGRAHRRGGARGRG